MRRPALLLAVGTALLFGLAALAQQAAPVRVITEPMSGRHFATPETLAMQDDDFDNPGFIWVEEGKAAWSTPQGEAGKSCASCHQDGLHHNRVAQWENGPHSSPYQLISADAGHVGLGVFEQHRPLDLVVVLDADRHDFAGAGAAKTHE